MNDSNIPFHYVCTRDEAIELSKKFDEFWVSNCGCRETGNGCERSRIDVCLFFKEYKEGSGSNFHKVQKEFLEELFKEAEEKHLVTRPFRDSEDMTKTAGICFCCDDCCEYLKTQNDLCDKGTLIEKTDLNKCTDCELCVAVCYFKARKMEDNKLVIEQDNCYGCGLCIDVCAVDCIKMVQRL
ncbi:MAG: hypothetical protein KAS53_06960 [Candidatus Cloacimonetes bacterium]|nr:hypothetical protein [Candidatus Cloacimonadota bacterium]